MTADGTYTYTYDDEGNRTSRTDDTTDYETLYEWDYRNRLTKVTELDDSDNTLKVVKYTYDVFDRRIGKAVDTTSPFDLADAAIERYLYDDFHGVSSVDGGNVVLDFVDPDGSGSTAIALESRQLYANRVDQILAKEDVTVATSSADRVQWPLVDNLGTVRDLVENDGALGEHYTYDAYGQVLSGDTSVIRYLYTSREHDPDTGLQYNRARWYDAAVGRWISQDPIGFDAGDANLSRYVQNAVVDSLDPSGLIDPGFDPSDPFGLKKSHDRLYRAGYEPLDPFGLFQAQEDYLRMRATYRHTTLSDFSPWGDAHTRPLTPGEIKMLEEAFAGHLDTEGIVVGIGGLLTRDYEELAKVPRYTPWFPISKYHHDFSLAPVESQGLFVHEMTHVLQSQQGQTNYLEATLLRLQHLNEYKLSYSIDPDRYGEPLWSFNMEQQAEIIRKNHEGIYDQYSKELQARVKKTIGDYQTQRPYEKIPTGTPYGP